MADKPDPIETTGTPEAVALRLFYDVALAELKETTRTGGQKPDREWILDTYAECLATVKNPIQRLNNR